MRVLYIQEVHFRFGEFVFDTETRDLRIGGETRRLTEKPALFLGALLEANGAVVTRDELRSAMWGDDTHVDFDANINIVAHRVREALGDSAEDPRLLETIPRKGYRIVVPIRGDDENRDRAHRLSPRLGAVAAIVAAGILALIAFVSVNRLGAGASSTGQEPPRLLVLPFESLGEGGAFAAGLSAELSARLGQADPARMTVYAPRTASAYEEMRRDGEPLPLEADFLVEGTVQRLPELTRVTVRLLEVPEMRVVWSREWSDRETELLAIQSEIAGAIARAAVPRVTLRGAEPDETGTLSPAAFEEYSLARERWSEFDGAGFRAALTRFERAVGYDPGYAEAWAGLADTWNMLALFGEVERAVAFEEAETAARRAIELDPDLAEGHSALAMTLYHRDGALDAALRAYERARDLNPGRALTHQWMAGLYTAMGRADDAVAAARRAHQLDPLSLSVSSDLGWHLYYARLYDEAIDQGEQTLALYPDSEPTLFFVELSQRARGMEREALATMLRRLRLRNVAAERIGEVERAHRNEGATRGAGLWADILEAEVGETGSYEVAVYRALEGDVNAAAEVIEEARRRELSWVPYIEADPVLGSL